MLSLTSLLHFSRCHCVGICAFLVPLNFLLTSVTLFHVSRGGPWPWVRLSSGLASLGAGCLALHVFSWLIIGVVMAPTYILLTIATVCLSLNLWAGLQPPSLQRILHVLFKLTLGKLVYAQAQG